MKVIVVVNNIIPDVEGGAGGKALAVVEDVGDFIDD